MNVNSVCISGTVDDDPVLSRTEGGEESLAFVMRVDGHADGRGVGGSNFVRCVVADSRAAALERRVRRGSLVTLSGELRQPYRLDHWHEDPDPPVVVVVGTIDVTSAPCSGSTLADVVGLGWRGDDP